MWRLYKLGLEGIFEEVERIGKIKGKIICEVFLGKCEIINGKWKKSSYWEIEIILIVGFRINEGSRKRENEEEVVRNGRRYEVKIDSLGKLEWVIIIIEIIVIKGIIKKWFEIIIRFE